MYFVYLLICLNLFHPSVDQLLFFFQNLSANLKQEPKHFRLSPLQCQFDFCESDFLDKNPRLRLLGLRAQGETEFRDWKQVPNREKEIPIEIFKVLKASFYVLYKMYCMYYPCFYTCIIFKPFFLLQGL